jgi:hypothetical protein
MANFEDRVEQPLALIQSPLVGANLLAAFKEKLTAQKVWQSMFGKDGERIFFDEIPNYNDTIFPLLELWWEAETYQSKNTRQSGSLVGRIALPVKLRGDKAVDHNDMRRVALAIQRFIGSDKCNLFSAVPGLIEFGLNTTFQYMRLFQQGAIQVPAIEMRVPVLFDLRLYQRLVPEAEVEGDLDAELLPIVSSYTIQPVDEEQADIDGSATVVTTG